MPYIVSLDGKSWRWVEPKDVPEGARVTNEKPAEPDAAPADDPGVSLRRLVKALIAKGVIVRLDIDRD